MFIIRGIAGPLAVAVETLDRIAEGDLTVVHSSAAQDETGQLLRAMAHTAQRLAERCRAAAMEIGTVVGSGMKQADRAGLLIKEIVPVIRQTSTLVQGIHHNAADESAAVTRMAGSMGQLDQLTRQNAAAAADLARTAALMNQQAVQLSEVRRLLASFHLPG